VFTEAARQLATGFQFPEIAIAFVTVHGKDQSCILMIYIRTSIIVTTNPPKISGLDLVLSSPQFLDQ
jgi:hypothetical protein